MSGRIYFKIAKHREPRDATWSTKDNMELSYYGGKSPSFTPAIQGQDSHIYASLFDPDNEPFEQMPLPVNTSHYSADSPMVRATVAQTPYKKDNRH